jgi:hypothetical protein
MRDALASAKCYSEPSPIFCIDDSSVTTRMLTADAFLVYSVTTPGLLAVPVDLLVFCAMVGALSHYGHSGVPRTDGHTVDPRPVPMSTSLVLRLLP